MLVINVVLKIDRGIWGREKEVVLEDEVFNVFMYILKVI